MQCRSSGSLVGIVLGAALAAGGLSGCGSGDFVPPPPPELQGALGGTPVPAGGPTPATAAAPLPVPTAGVRSLELILGGPLDPEEAETEKSAARSQAGLDKARLRITPEALGQSAATGKEQARLIREAVARHPQVLIVVPAQPADAELAQAVRAAREAKIPVILVGRPIAAGAADTPVGPKAAPEILVAPPPPADSARHLVASAIRNARNAQLEPKGGALLLVNTVGDALVPDRAAALRAALKAAGITAVAEIHFAHDIVLALKHLTQRLQDDPKTVLVLSADSQGTSASNQAVSELGTERPFIQAGYTSTEAQIRMVNAGEYAALAEFAPNRMIRKAVSTAVALAQGRDVPSRVEISIVVHDSPAKSGAPHLQAEFRARKKAPGGNNE